MGFTENVIEKLTKETIKTKRLIKSDCTIKLVDNKEAEDMYITIDCNGKRYGNIFHYGKLGYDKYIMIEKLRRMRFLKRQIEYQDYKQEEIEETE